LASAPVEKPRSVRNEPFESELPPVAYQCVAPVQLADESSVSIAAWSRSMRLCCTTDEPGV
jgi:hypothetical protein